MSIRRLLRIATRWLLLFTIFIVLITGGLFVYRFFFSYTYDASLEQMTDEELGVTAKPAWGVTNIALFGVDTRPHEPTRSDCMMILSVDATRGELKLTSLMRDSKVKIDGHGEDKLCHAYSYTGPKGAIQAINQNFGMNITDYAEVNFLQMANLIDAVGGVEVTVSEKERKEANKFIREYYDSIAQPPVLIEKAGRQHLNGGQAMTFARIRKGGTGDDWGRVERQSIVLEAMFRTVQDKSVAELAELMPKLLPYVTTSLKKTEMLSLAAGLFQHGRPSMQHTRFPQDGEWAYGGSQGQYIVYDVQAIGRQIDAYIYDDVLPQQKQADDTDTEDETDRS